MQFLRGTRDAILKPLQTVAGIVERRHTMQILANVLMRKQGEEVSFLASDMEIQIQTTASLGPGEDEAATTVSARKLIDILKALPDNVEVTMSVANRKATISAGKSRFSLQTLAAEDFPLVNVSEDLANTISISQRQLKHLLQMVHFAMAQQDVRFYLNGLLMVTEGDVVRVVATDGHRLAYCQASLEQPAANPQESIIPRKTVLELQRLLQESDEPVLIDMAVNQIRFRFGDVNLVSKLVEGKFPDYRRVIPTTHKRVVGVSRDLLASSLGRVSILTSEKFKGVRFTLNDSSLKIQTNNAEQEEAVEELEVDFEGEELDIGFNVAYLLEGLNNLKVENLQIAFGDAGSSALMTVQGDDSFKYVVMPMRI
jgi:DNA polymerase-3 subunit beta